MWDKIVEIFDAIVLFFYKVYLSVYNMFLDLGLLILDTVTTAALYVIDSISSGFDAVSPLQYVNAIPSETKAIMSACGFNEAMVIIVSAITIRMLLQIIPFVRLGS